MEIKFTINDFEGPLDFLLHLIKKKKKSIIDINVLELANQYMVFIENNKNLNFDLTTEYLVMASYFIELKSKALLPIEIINVDSNYQELEKGKLITKLIEYKKYKDSTAYFQNQELIRNKLYTKMPDYQWLKFKKTNLNSVNDIFSLTNAFLEMQKRIALARPINTLVAKTKITIQEREQQIIDYLKKQKKTFFSNLIDDNNNMIFLVVTFICILDLAKKRFIKINQNKLLNDINIEIMGE